MGNGRAAAESVHSLFRENGLTLAVAESCTGGLICHWLTDIPGASMFLKAGIVAYSPESKETILGVPSSVLAEHGAVSSEAARAMAERARLVAGADYGLATTGNLGPDRLEGKHVGLVFVAASGPLESHDLCLTLTGNRTTNKEHAAEEALVLLLNTVREGRGQ